MKGAYDMQWRGENNNEGVTRLEWFGKLPLLNQTKVKPGVSAHVVTGTSKESGLTLPLNQF